MLECICVALSTHNIRTHVHTIIRAKTPVAATKVSGRPPARAELHSAIRPVDQSVERTVELPALFLRAVQFLSFFRTLSSTRRSFIPSHAAIIRRNPAGFPECTSIFVDFYFGRERPQSFQASALLTAPQPMTSTVAPAIRSCNMFYFPCSLNLFLLF